MANVTFNEKYISNTVTEFRSTSNNRNLRFYSLLMVFFASFMVYFAMISRYHWVVSLLVLESFMLFIMRSTVKEESVTVIRNFGIQLRTKYIIGRDTAKFLDIDKIEGSFMHEYIQGSQVHFCLGFIVSGEKKLTLVFNVLYPGFQALRRVYKACQNGR